MRSPFSVVVAGDVTIDWNIARIRERLPDTPLVWNAGDITRACPQAGGAALLADLIAAVARRSAGVPRSAIQGPGVDLGAVRPGDPAFRHSYALWTPHPARAAGAGGAAVWRVESYLGMDVMPARSGRKPMRVRDDRRAVLYALDDAALGFRDHPEAWPAAVKSRACPGWVLVKTASPVAAGDGGGPTRPPVWQQLVAHCPHRLIVLMTADDLRHTEVQVSRELSWERLAQDLLWALTYNPRVHGLSRCAHVVVSLGTAGALWLRRPATRGAAASGASCSLIYDPLHFEGQWNARYPGGMIGFMTCLAAGVARQVLLAPRDPDIGEGIQAGIRAMRALQEGGFGRSRSPAATGSGEDVRCGAGDGGWPAFPHDRLVEAMNSKGELPRVEVPSPLAEESPSPWSILDARSSSPDGASSPAARAERIVLEGLDAGLESIPRAAFGKLTTADRHEIEGLRSLRGLLAEYCAGGSNKPISIAVFGPPGSGKSFGVKQVAASIGGGTRGIEFDLSQFDDPRELVGALHQVRDIGLQGSVPLVFWDEFDSRLGAEDCGWLRHFLAPMQGGVFQDGQVTHHIGRAIFVFAGGTSYRMADFVRRSREERLRGAKLADFVSRLKGFYDALGPDPLDLLSPQGDPQHVVRRAVLLRSLLAANAPQLFDEGRGRGRLAIDPGVLRAFLFVSRYRHGVRSMEAIIAMSILADRAGFERSSLPCVTQLDLHVDATEFLSLVQQPDFGKDIEKLAAAFHETYRRSQARKRPRPKYAAVAYARLPEAVRAENRANVLDIGRKLAACGCVMVPAAGAAPEARLTPEDFERMARMEHDRWVRSKLAQGWRWGEPRNDAARIHPALRPWERLTEGEKALMDPRLLALLGEGPLPEADREKDRKLVRGIPKILALAGYRILKIEPPREGSGRATNA